MAKVQDDLPNTPHYKAFLSHKSSDKPVVECIGEHLLSSGVGVFFDEWDISGGDSIPEAIEQAITECNILVYALSPASVKSKWVKTEYHSFLYRKINANTLRIIPVLLADCEKPALIAPLKHIDFRKFAAQRPETHNSPMEELLKTIFGTSRKPATGVPHPALASFELFFQKAKKAPGRPENEYWELAFKNVTDSPLHNFEFAVEFSEPIVSIVYEHRRSSANMTGGQGLSADGKIFHWFGNQLMEDDGWAVFLIHSKTMPSMKRLYTKLLGRNNDKMKLFAPDPEGLKRIVSVIVAQ